MKYHNKVYNSKFPTAFSHYAHRNRQMAKMETQLVQVLEPEAHVPKAALKMSVLQSVLDEHCFSQPGLVFFFFVPCISVFTPGWGLET